MRTFKMHMLACVRALSLIVNRSLAFHQTLSHAATASQPAVMGHIPSTLRSHTLLHSRIHGCRAPPMGIEIGGAPNCDSFTNFPTSHINPNILQAAPVSAEACLCMSSHYLVQIRVKDNNFASISSCMLKLHLQITCKQLLQTGAPDTLSMHDTQVARNPG